jgi:lysophospholipase L1-like esterase
VGVGLAWAVQALFSPAFRSQVGGGANVSRAELGPLWAWYCRPSEASLLRAAGFSDLGAWWLESLGDLLCVGVAIVAVQAARVGPTRDSLRLRGGPLGLATGDLAALSAAVLLLDLAYLVSPGDVVAWELASDLGLGSSSVLVASVVSGCVLRLRPAWVSTRLAETFLAVSLAVLCIALLLGGFLTALLSSSGTAVGPRGPLVAVLGSGTWWVAAHRHARSATPERDAGAGAGGVRQNVLLLLASLALVLLLVDAGARWILIDESYEIQAADGTPETVGAVGGAGRAAQFVRLVRPSTNPRLVYELRPNLAARIDMPSAAAMEFRTNSFGMRGPPLSLEKPAGTIRIAGLGDSVTFGWGVDYEETQLAVLGRLLQQGDPHHRYEVLNFGVPGYNTVMQHESFKEIVRQFSPDLVVLTLVANDADLPNYLQKPRNPFCLHRSFMSGLLRRSLLGLDPYAAHDILVAQSAEGSRGRFSSRAGLTPVGSERLSGQENATEALRQLYRDVLASGSRLIVTTDYHNLDHLLDRRPSPRRLDFQESMLETARELGITVVDPRDILVGYLRSHDLRSADLWVAANDPHPGPVRHRLTAEALLEPALEVLAREPQ